MTKLTAVFHMQTRLKGNFIKPTQVVKNALFLPRFLDLVQEFHADENLSCCAARIVHTAVTDGNDDGRISSQSVFHCAEVAEAANGRTANTG